MRGETTNRTFDELAGGLASGTLTRGKALRLMGAALVGGTLSSLGMGGVAAADDECKPVNKKCRKNAQCCSGKCEGGKCAPACVSTDSQGCTADSECCSESARCIEGSCLEEKSACACTCMDGAQTSCCATTGCGQVCLEFCANHGGIQSGVCAPTFFC